MTRKFILLGLASVTALAGCVPTTAWYKGTVTQNRANNELTSCQVKANNDVGTSIETKQTGGYMIGYVYIPTYGNVDTNDQLRQKVVAQCMTNLGYRTVELPLCPANTATPDLNAVATVTESSCFKAIPGGYYAIAQK